MVPRQSEHAFTLTELLVAIAMLALLAMVVLPALAGAANKGGRAQCANNLRQIGVSSMMYATEYNDMMPICKVGIDNSGGKFNNLRGLWFTRYVAYGEYTFTFVPTNATSVSFDCLGFLYHVGLAGNGSIFYCPEQWGTAYGANTYSPLLTTDGSGAVRSSYLFNPRIVDPTNNIIARRYPKTSDLPPHKLYAVDDIEFQGSGHFRERGWNVLFTDGSVQFSQNVQAYNLIQTFVSTETTQAYEEADQIFNCLELDH